jgi:hypothetical protein
MALWSFDRIAQENRERADQLMAAPPCDDLFHRCVLALSAAISSGQARFGLEQADENAAHLRAVVQFYIGQPLFDWFFNAATGYRAQFRIGWRNGLARNCALIQMLRQPLEAIADKEISVWRFTRTFEDRGLEQVTIGRIVQSLDPALSKVWCCDTLIRPERMASALEVFRTGAGLLIDGEERQALTANDANAWLDVKGAFFGDGDRLYQTKDPVVRAHNLEQRLSA